MSKSELWDNRRTWEWDRNRHGLGGLWYSTESYEEVLFSLEWRDVSQPL